MSILIAIIILVILGFILTSLYKVFKEKLSFFITGLDSKFSFADLILLWNVAKICELDNPNKLFYSLSSLSQCMTEINRKATEEGIQDSNKMQNLLSKLYNFRTKLQNESDDKKGIDSTKSLDRGQKLRVILPGKGVFASEVLNNASELIVTVPKKKDLITIPAEEWDGKVINVYLWKKGDARYVFDTTVLRHGPFVGESALALQHSNNLTRTQKRKAVRVKCNIKAQLFIIRDEVIDYDVILTKGGYRCVLEDISESGCLIRTGGKGIENLQVCVQFNIQSTLIAMFGVIRTVEFNEETNQSLLHFECIHLQKNMKNTVLSFVYDTMSEKDKEVYEALTLTDTDENEEEVENNKLPSEKNMEQSEEQENQLNEGEFNPNSLPSLEEEPSDSLNVFDNYS